jgi:hypothetical protein
LSEEISGVDTMLALAECEESYLLSQKPGERDQFWVGRLRADKTGWSFVANNTNDSVDHGVYTTAWRPVAEDPLVAGLTLGEREVFIMSRRPEEGELEKWSEILKIKDNR